MFTNAQLYTVISLLLGGIITLSKLLLSRAEKRVYEKIDFVNDSLSDKIELLDGDLAQTKKDLNRRLELQDIAVDEVERNYNAKFEKVYNKQDETHRIVTVELMDRISEVKTLIESQSSYCKGIQEGTKNKKPR